MDNKFVLKDRTYSFGIIPATEAVIVEIAIAKVIGEPLFAAFMGKDEESKKMGAIAIGLIVSKMEADELLKTMNTVFNYTSCDGKRINIDSTFTGRNKELLQVFVAALRFNFSDFLDGILLTSDVPAPM